MITEVVPSPTSSSWALDNSIILFAAGWLTSTSLKMQFPSLVMTIPPMGSNNIFNIALGPSVVLMISDTAYHKLSKRITMKCLNYLSSLNISLLSGLASVTLGISI